MIARFALLFAAAALCDVTFAAVPEAVPDQSSPSEQPMDMDAMRTAAMAVLELDPYVLLADKEASSAALGHLAILEPALASAESEATVAIRYIKQFALLGVGRTAEAETLSKHLLQEYPHNAVAYDGRFVTAMVAEKPHDIVEALEMARSSGLSGEARDQILMVFSADRVRSISQALYIRKDEVGRYRLAEALLALGWDAEGNAVVADVYRKLALDGRLKNGDRPGAQALLDDIDTPDSILDLVVSKKYDPLFNKDADRVRLLSRALQLEAGRSGRDYNAEPENAKARLRRIMYLRSVGDHVRIVELTDDFAADIALVAETGDDAFWAINQRAYSLLDLGRSDEAVALMEKLLSLDFVTYPSLVNMSINHAAILNSADRHADALAHATRLVDTTEGYASPYGKMWIWSEAACASGAEGLDLEAKAWLEKLQANRADNMAALTRALVCLNRLDAAVAIVVERLSGEDPSEVIITLQDYRDDASASTSKFERLMEARWEEVAARPAVVAALEKVGRVLALPLAKSYWGSF